MTDSGGSGVDSERDQFSLVAGSYLPFEAFLRYPLAHFIATVSAGLLVFLALAALQACIALVLPERLLRRVSMLAQLLFVIVLIEWLVFAPGLLVRLAAIDPDATSEALAAADSPYRFVGLTSSRAGERYGSVVDSRRIDASSVDAHSGGVRSCQSVACS